jgi:hypothetical protein
MSDLSGATAPCSRLLFILDSGRCGAGQFTLAIVLGLALCIRPQLLFFAPLLLAAALFPVRHSWHMAYALLSYRCGIHRASVPYFLLILWNSAIH